MEDPVADQIEDDLFYADLSRQISLLIMDDDEDIVSSHNPSDSIKAYTSQVSPPPPTQYPYLYEQARKRESKGTGVFIPRSSQPRRTKKQDKSETNKSHKQPDNSKGLSRLSYNDSFGPKRCSS